MYLAKVTGNVTCTAKVAPLAGRKLLLVRRLDIDPRELSGPETVALDVAQAGVGDTVLVLKEGGSAKIALKDKEANVAQIVVGIVDEIDARGWTRPPAKA